MDRPASLGAALIAATTRPASAGGSPPACPTGADARGGPDRGIRRAADAHRQIGLYGLRGDGDALLVWAGAAEVDRLLSPQAADDIEALVGLATARLGVDAERLPFGPQRAADAEGRQQAAL